MQLAPIAAAFSCLAAVAAQTNLTAHPQETLTGGGGNYATFGVFSTGSGAEGRTQILVPKDELPNAGAMLTGIELLALVGGTVDYASLEIRASATPATSLGNSFAANVVGPETVVLQATSLQVAYSTSAWVPIVFTQNYVHDGTSALLLDVRKVVQTAPTYAFVTIKKNANPPRIDRPVMVYAFGGPGSGVSNASSAFASDEPISFRLRWIDAPTLQNRGDSGMSGTQYALGSSVVFTMQSDPGLLWVLAGGDAFLTTSLMIPGILGTFRLSGPLVLAAGLLDLAGEGMQVVPIPNTPGLVGAYFAYQAATVDLATGAIVLTNGTDHFVN